jgi:hypothetical protein
MKLSELKIKMPAILLYGKHGTGKTAFMLTLGERLQVVDADEGLLTGLTLKDEFLEARRSVDVVSCLETDPKKGTKFPLIKKHIKKVMIQCQQGRYPFDALGIDSLTSLCDSATRYILGNCGLLGQADEPKMQIQHWGSAFIEIQSVITMLKAIPVFVIILAHEHHYEEDGATKTKIAIPGKSLPGTVCKMFDELWRMRIKNLSGGKTAYVIKTRGTGDVEAKTRLNVPAEMNADKGLPKILQDMGFEWPLRKEKNEASTV